VLGPLRGTHGRSGFTTARGGSPSAFFPLERLERAVPLDLPVVPLLRALVTGDAEAAAELGCLELDPEDLALVSFLCPAKLEYGHLLRSVLNDLEPRSP
jgi:Na+-transporting NADH:ubiquinone oxidoreductase subunit A